MLDLYNAYSIALTIFAYAAIALGGFFAACVLAYRLGRFIAGLLLGEVASYEKRQTI